MEDYYQNKKQKRNDLLKGILINLITGIAISILYLFDTWALSAIKPENIAKTVGIIAIVIMAVAAFIFEFILIRKYFKGRRYIAIGMIVALVLPLLAFGACSPFLMNVGLG